jgi:hypothetical protein
MEHAQVSVCKKGFRSNGEGFLEGFRGFPGVSGAIWTTYNKIATMPQIYDLRFLFGNHCTPQQNENVVMTQQLLGRKGFPVSPQTPYILLEGELEKVRVGFAEKHVLLEF